VRHLAGLITDRIIIDAVHQHHERWDGNGYPEGLRGEQIAPSARVIAVADVYDAIRSDRPYKRGWSHEEAVAYIGAGSGTLFDPVIVVAFLALSDALAALHPERITSP
jgi:putative two-component system response regulator